MTVLNTASHFHLDVQSSFYIAIHVFLPHQVLSMLGDVTCEQDVKELVEEAILTFGQIDHLVSMNIFFPSTSLVNQYNATSIEIYSNMVASM